MEEGTFKVINDGTTTTTHSCNPARQKSKDPLDDFSDLLQCVIDEVMGMEGSVCTPGDMCQCKAGLQTTRCVDCPTKVR